MGVSLSLGVESRPSYRGVLQATDHQPVLHGLVEVAAESGWYAGVWASRFETVLDDRKSQVDYYVGYQARMSADFALAVNLQRYTYQGADFGNDYDWNEIQVKAFVGNHFSVLVGAGDNWIGRDQASYVLEGAYQYALSERFSAFATLGHHFAADVVGTNFSYREVGLGGKWLGFDVRVSWADAVGIDNHPVLADVTWSVSLSRRFSFGR